jgi:hypothetical protein
MPVIWRVPLKRQFVLVQPAPSVFIDALVFILRKEIAALAAKYRVPVIDPSREDVEAGGLIAYGTAIPEQYRQAATFVHKILGGAKPAELPVEQPTKFELAINLKTAKQIALTIPQSMLYRADKVIKIRSTMTVDKDKTVTLEELMVSTLAMAERGGCRGQAPHRKRCDLRSRVQEADC